MVTVTNRIGELICDILVAPGAAVPERARFGEASSEVELWGRHAHMTLRMQTSTVSPPNAGDNLLRQEAGVAHAATELMARHERLVRLAQDALTEGEKPIG